MVLTTGYQGNVGCGAPIFSMRSAHFRRRASAARGCAFGSLIEALMTAEDQLQSLIQRWSLRSISTNEIARELRGLHDAFANAYYREKVRNAIEWAKMSSQEAQEYGGEQQVHEFMLSELTVAARVAGQLQGKE
jgi:hypothetical protein